MALLEDQIEEAQAALIAAHDAKDVEGAQVLADHVRELQAQKDTVDKAALESSKEGTNLRNPLIAGGTGAVAGALVNPVINAAQDIVARPKLPSPPPSQITTPAAPWTPPKFTPQGMPVDPNVPRDVYHWMSGNPESGSTGQHAGVPVRGRNQLEAEKLAQEFHAKNAARADFEAKNPGRSILDNGLEVSKADYDYVEGMKKKNQDAALLEHRIEQNAAKSAAAKQAESAGRFNILPSAHQPSTPFSIVKGGAKGAVTGASIADIPQQLSQGNYGTAAADTGIAGGNIINSLGRTPKTKAIGKLIGIGSGVLRGVQGVNELTGAPEEQKATGGLVHLANGGQPEDSPYVGYPQVNRNRQEGYGTGYLNTLATAIDPTGLTAAIPEANASMLSETPKERSYREGKEAAQPIAEVIGNLQMLNFGKQLVKPALKYAIPKAMKTVEQLKHLNTPHGYSSGKRVIAEEALGLAKKAAKMSPGIEESLGKILPKSKPLTLAEKFGYDPVKLRNEYPQTSWPVSAWDKNKESYYAAKSPSSEELALKAARDFAQEEIKSGSAAYKPYFDVSKRGYVDPSNYPLPGPQTTSVIPKQQKTIDAYTAKFQNPEAIQKWSDAYDLAKNSPNAHHFYAMDQLEKKYVEKYGPELGRQKFKT